MFPGAHFRMWQVRGTNHSIPWVGQTCLSRVLLLLQNQKSTNAPLPEIDDYFITHKSNCNL